MASRRPKTDPKRKAAKRAPAKRATSKARRAPAKRSAAKRGRRGTSKGGVWPRVRRFAARIRADVERAVSVFAGAALVVLALWVALCVPPPPTDPENLCRVFEQKPAWYDAAVASHERWGVPPSVLLAIVFQESSFHADAQPARRVWLGFLPGFRPSSAYGFGQILDGTWTDYLATLEPERQRSARRDRFEDVADFVGWYANTVERRTGVSPDDARELYLAYHEGPGGYARDTHRDKAWLLGVADRVAARAARYEAQYAGCRAELEDASWLPFL